MCFVYYAQDYLGSCNRSSGLKLLCSILCKAPCTLRCKVQCFVMIFKQMNFSAEVLDIEKDRIKKKDNLEGRFIVIYIGSFRP